MKDTEEDAWGEPAIKGVAGKGNVAYYMPWRIKAATSLQDRCVSVHVQKKKAIKQYQHIVKLVSKELY